MRSHRRKLAETEGFEPCFVGKPEVMQGYSLLWRPPLDHPSFPQFCPQLCPQLFNHRSHHAQNTQRKSAIRSHQPDAGR